MCVCVCMQIKAQYIICNEYANFSYRVCTLYIYFIYYNIICYPRIYCTYVYIHILHVI